MSLQIGYTQPNVTNKERIWLHSDTQSNLVILNTSLGSSGIAFDRFQQYIFGLSNDNFRIEKGNTKIGVFGTSSSFISSALRLGSDLTVDRSLVLRQGFTGSNMVASNLTLFAPTPTFNANTAAFSIRTGGADILTTSVNNRGTSVLSFIGNVGIGTSTPQYSLHVQSNASIGQTLNVGTSITTPIIKHGACNILNMSSDNVFTIDANKLIVRGDTYIDGLLSTSNFKIDTSLFDNVVVSSNLSTQSMSMINIRPSRDTVSILHDGQTYSNVLNINLLSPSLPTSFDTLTLDYAGRLGIGTHYPEAIIHIEDAPIYGMSNGILVCGADTESDIVLNTRGHVGIGTTNALYRLHIYSSNDDIDPQSYQTLPMIGLTNESSNMPYFTAYSNQVLVASMSRTGSLALGSNVVTDDGWNLVAASNIKTPVLNVERIESGSLTSSIDFANTSTCNINLVHTTDIVSTAFTSTSNLVTNFFFASNYSIPAFNVLNTFGYMGVNLPQTWISSSRVGFTNTRDDPNINVFANGKVRIEADTPGNLQTTSIGLHVFGAGRTSAKISSSLVPSLTLTQIPNNITAGMDIDLNDNFALRFTHSALAINSPFSINSDGIKMINRNIQIDTLGRLGIGIEVTDIQASLHVKNNVRFDTLTGTQVVKFNSASGALGLGVEPSYPFHVNVNSVFTKPIQVSEQNVGITGAGKLGVGTDAPGGPFRVYISGDVNIDGEIYRSTTEKFLSTQWTTVNRNVCMLGGSNVGIGTNNAQNYGLYVENTAFFRSNVTFQGSVTSQGSITSISDRTLKENMAPITYPLDRVNKMTGYIYDRVDSGAREVGLIAQDVQEVFPELVRPTESDSKLLSIAYGNMAALFVEAIKELNQRVTNLESALASYQSRS